MSTISCSTGVYDCSYRDIPSGDLCSPYDGDYKDMEGRLWIVVTSCLIMCAMAFGMGSNDAGTSLYSLLTPPLLTHTLPSPFSYSCYL